MLQLVLEPLMSNFNCFNALTISKLTCFTISEGARHFFLLSF
jgi:hypothetical protein